MNALLKKRKNSNPNALPIELDFYLSIFSNDKFKHLIKFEKEEIIYNKMIGFVGFKGFWTCIRFFKDNYFSPIEDEYFFFYDHYNFSIGTTFSSISVMKFSVNESTVKVNIISDIKL